MKKFKHILILGAVILCIAAFVFPMAAFAATDEDTTPPTLTAKLVGETLHIEVNDDMSGVEAVYVDNTRINSMVNGKASVALKDYAGNNKQVVIYAVDYSDNRSQTVNIDNPYYKAPSPLPSASKPSASTPTPAPSTPQPSSSTPSNSSSGGSSSSTQPSPSTLSASSSEPELSSSSIPDGDNPFTPDGQGTVVDHATDTDGKEFYTIITADGNVFYLIIDHEKGTQNVYFLRTVTEKDLIALAEKNGDSSGQSAIATPEPTPQSKPEPEPTPESKPEKESSGIGTIFLLLIAVAGIGGAGWYIKIYKPKHEAELSDDFDEEDEDEDDEEIQFDDEETQPACDGEADYLDANEDGEDE